jgi:hypothetical protein
MSEPSFQLIQKMRVSREAVARKLGQVSSREGYRSSFVQRFSITPERIGIAVGVALALTVLFPARRAETRKPPLRAFGAALTRDQACEVSSLPRFPLRLLRAVFAFINWQLV